MSARRDGWRQRALAAEAALGVIDVPEIREFIIGLQREAMHARKRWGAAHDARKAPEDWLWAIAYLTTKATQAARVGDQEQYLHHIITSAGLLANWHAHAVARPVG